MKRSILLSLIFFSFVLSLQANNIQVSNVGFNGTPGQGIYQVYFDIAWENSWRTSTYESNYDAAWVFVKYKRTTDDSWFHAQLAGEADSQVGLELVFPSDNKGLFIQRASNGIGDVNFTDVMLNWQLGGAFSPDDEVEICVYAIEMVYIPEGPFQLGDGFSTYRLQAGDSGAPFEMLSESGLTLGGTSLANLSKTSLAGFDDFNSETTQFLPAPYPKGFKAFYMMKYEISQGQYAAFLNTLSTDIATQRFPDQFGESGHTIRTVGFPTKYIADAPERAANYFNWGDIAIYADWAGLRPMSELEYEKACRGPLTPRAGEYAWGTSAIYSEEYLLSGEGGPEEIIIGGVEGLGNSFFASTTSDFGPKRCGIFAASYDSPSRLEAGASYYGVLELSGNVWETTIGLGRPQCRVFNGNIHGDGIVSTVLPFGWPSIATGLGSGHRGGSYINSRASLNTSHRVEANVTIGEERNSNNGGRLVRSDF